MATRPDFRVGGSFAFFAESFASFAVQDFVLFSQLRRLKPLTAKNAKASKSGHHPKIREQEAFATRFMF
jgi:hypothetical protein